MHRSYASAATPTLVSAVPSINHAEVYVYGPDLELAWDDDFEQDDDADDFDWWHGVRSRGD
jgi:hypothetical protein